MTTRKVSNASDPATRTCRCGILRATCWRCAGVVVGAAVAPGGAGVGLAQPRPGLEEEGAHRSGTATQGCGKGYESPAPGLRESFPGGPPSSLGSAPVGAPGAERVEERVGEREKGPL